MNENGISLLGSSANGTFVLTDNNDIVLGNDNYKVGIGTTSPKTKLQIGGQENYPSYISNSEEQEMMCNAFNGNIFNSA